MESTALLMGLNADGLLRNRDFRQENQLSEGRLYLLRLGVLL